MRHAMPIAAPSRTELRSDSLTRYLDDIRAYRILTREEETALAARVRRGERDALSALVCANLRFVVSVAKKYQHLGVPLADLVSEGNLGLLRAAGRFDGEVGVRFISYAVRWIRQSILHALAKQSRIVRIPPSRAGASHRLGRRANLLRHRLQREPTSEELAEELGVSADEVMRTMALLQSPRSLDAPGEENISPLSGRLIGGEESTPDTDRGGPRLALAVARAMHGIRAREALVLRLYFGLDGRDAMTLEEIGNALGLTRERVRQIKDKALARLRQMPELAAEARREDVCVAC